MKKILFSAILATTLMPLAMADAPRMVASYEQAQASAPEGGYVVALYADGWDKYSKKLAQKLLKDKDMQEALADCAVIEYAVPNLSSEASNKARADKLGKLKWVGANTYPAFALYDKTGRHYATVLVPYADRKDTDKIANQITKARESVTKQNALLEQAKGEQGLAKAQTLGKAAVLDNINRPDNILKMIKEADPQDKSGYVRRLEFSVHNYAEGTAKTKDWQATLKEVEDRIADKSYSVAQRQGLYAVAVGLLRRHGSVADQKKMLRYLREMKKLDPTSPLGRSADHAETIWFSQLSLADGWSPGVLPKDDKPAEIAGPLPIKAAGTYVVKFTYTRGSHQLVVKGVRLYDGSRLIAEDMHEGTTGVKHNKNEYTLEVPAKVKVPKLEAIFHMPKNRDSYGTISIQKK